MLYESTVPQYIKMMKNLSNVLEKGAAHAEAKKVDFSVLLNSRLAPDQFPLLRQIQIATDSAKLGISRTTGKEAPPHDDKETTLAEIKARIESVVNYLKTITPKDFEGMDAKRVTTPRWEGKTLSGTEFLVQQATPNVYFHVTTAYAILRNNGADVGKKDFLGELPFRAN